MYAVVCEKVDRCRHVTRCGTRVLPLCSAGGRDGTTWGEASLSQTSFLKTQTSAAIGGWGECVCAAFRPPLGSCHVVFHVLALQRAPSAGPASPRAPTCPISTTS